MALAELLHIIPLILIQSIVCTQTYRFIVIAVVFELENNSRMANFMDMKRKTKQTKNIQVKQATFKIVLYCAVIFTLTSTYFGICLVLWH